MNRVKLQEKNYTKQEALSRNVLDDFKTVEDGKYNFIIEPAMSNDGELCGFYTVFQGRKLVGTYKTVKACRRAIRRNFIVDKDGNGLIDKDDYNVIKINYL